MDIELPRDFLTKPDCQAESPLFQLPLEVRQRIYELSFKKEQVSAGNYVKGVDDGSFVIHSDESDHSGSSFDESLPNWLRPGCTTRMRINTALLRTCQLVHDEASSILLSTTVHTCYQGYGPGVSPFDYFLPLTEKQLAAVRHLHLFTHVCDFDRDGLWLRKQLQPVAQSLQHLTITFRDLGRAPATRMLLNPFQHTMADRQTVDELMEKAKKGEEAEMPEDGWAGTFVDLPALKTLTMEFEDSEEREKELETFVLWSKTWKFPLGEGQFMSSDSVPESYTWRRPKRHHHHSCHESYVPPRVTTWTLKWDVPAGRIPPSRVMQKKKLPMDITGGARIDRPAYDPCLGGLNSIFSGASDEQMRELISWGVL